MYEKISYENVNHGKDHTFKNAFLVFAMAAATPNPAPGLMGSSSLQKRGLLDPIIKAVTDLLEKVFNKYKINELV
ncbi:hypothetical protein Avbf_14070 [Armadillidium vulgare]|nr:hypothetical protein Avbf_14070 [Armadillidium vulgare]